MEEDREKCRHTIEVMSKQLQLQLQQHKKNDADELLFAVAAENDDQAI